MHTVLKIALDQTMITDFINTANCDPKYIHSQVSK